MRRYASKTSVSVAKPWDLLLWGVELTTQRGIDPILIGRGWDRPLKAYYLNEPLRALLFTQFKPASAWCKAMNDRHRSQPRTDRCYSWRFRPVRVRERVEKV